MLVKVIKIPSLNSLKAKCQVEFNRYIRNRDENLGCISCGAQGTEAGHYYSAGHYSSLRFNETNTNLQCSRCNCFLHGNLIRYRNGLINRYGTDKVYLLDSLATRNPVTKWSRSTLEILLKLYKEKNKEFE